MEFLTIACLPSFKVPINTRSLFAREVEPFTMSAAYRVAVNFSWMLNAASTNSASGVSILAINGWSNTPTKVSLESSARQSKLQVTSTKNARALSTLLSVDFTGLFGPVVVLLRLSSRTSRTRSFLGRGVLWRGVHRCVACLGIRNLSPVILLPNWEFFRFIVNVFSSDSPIFVLIPVGRACWEYFV